MQRVQKQGSESENAQRTAQAKFTSKSREAEQANGIDDSPAMIAQRKKLQSLFGGAIQRVEDEEPLQGKFDSVQRVEEEELLQGKFEAAQRVEEEEPLQGKFEAVQRVEEEEPLQGKFETAQRVEEEEPLQGKFEPVQRVEEEEPLQGKFEAASSTQLKEEVAKPNNTGLPDNLKSGIESLSGMSMDNVKVHYNSSQPAQLNALAYAQGTDIHVAPGQEQHLPHEAWHVVQQAQGRVKPTMQMKEGVPVNDDKSLEHEADVMGAKAAAVDVAQGKLFKPATIDASNVAQLALDSSGSYTTGATLPVTANSASVTGTKSLSGSPVSATIYVTSISSTSSPADPIDFQKWKDYGSLNLLHEHSRAYNLTRMHAIRGKFHGPGRQDNMFLGTMASNNTHSNSHLNEVERPIENFINSTSGQRGVSYTVTPDYSSAPSYITTRAAGISNSTDRSAFLAWAPEACPASFTCTATFYKTNTSSLTGYESKTDTVTISTAL